MKQVLFFPILLASFFSAQIAPAQILDAYGFRIGAGLASQYWNYKLVREISHQKEKKTALAVHLLGEKELRECLTLRAELGYIQKGFQEEFIFAEPFDPVRVSRGNVSLHNLTLGISTKMNFLSKNAPLRPYILLGLRGEYLMDYQDVVFSFQEERFRANEGVLNNFNKLTAGVMAGLGFVYRQLLLVDLEYNPSFTKNLNLSTLSVRDSYYGVTLGVYMNEVFNSLKK